MNRDTVLYIIATLLFMFVTVFGLLEIISVHYGHNPVPILKDNAEVSIAIWFISAIFLSRKPKHGRSKIRKR
jgi:hypothetical protein